MKAEKVGIDFCKGKGCYDSLFEEEEIRGFERRRGIPAGKGGDLISQGQGNILGRMVGCRGDKG